MSIPPALGGFFVSIWHREVPVPRPVDKMMAHGKAHVKKHTMARGDIRTDRVGSRPGAPGSQSNKAGTEVGSPASP
jgi:hypothetical protein